MLPLNIEVVCFGNDHHIAILPEWFAMRTQKKKNF